jgi:hypothetical protein
MSRLLLLHCLLLSLCICFLSKTQMHPVTLSQPNIELSPHNMAPRDPAGIGPAETLSFLYRIETTADDMSKRPTLDPDHPVSADERAAWATIKSLSNLMHAEFSAILNRSYDPHRHIALLVEVIRLHDYRHLCGLVGMNVPPVVEMSHAAQQRGKHMSEQKWTIPGSESWLEVLEPSPAAPQHLAKGSQHLAKGSQHLAEGSQDLPSLSQLLPVVPKRLPRAPSFYSTNPASYITAPIPPNATQIPWAPPPPPSKSRKRKSRSEQKASSSRQPSSSFEKQPPSEQATPHQSQVEGRGTDGKSHVLCHPFLVHRSDDSWSELY